MKLGLRISLIFAAALLIGAGSAKADTILYFDLTGPDGFSATFQLPSHPVVEDSDLGFGFMVMPIDLKIGGVASDDILGFYGPMGGGALAAFSDDLTADFSLMGGQVYHGNEFAPFFQVTRNHPFHFTEQFTNVPGYELTIGTSPSSVPEPSTILLLCAGLLPLGLLAKRWF